MDVHESEEARREREGCPVCRSSQRRSVERMRRLERAPFAELQRYLVGVGEEISLRAVMRHFGRGHDRFSPSDDTDLPAWLFDDEVEFERYLHQYGFCRTIDDLCPHVPPRTVSTCEAIEHPECARWRVDVLRERVAELEARQSASDGERAGGAGPLALVEPLTVRQALEVEGGSGSSTGIYASSVVAIDHAQLVITRPIRLREVLPLAPGDRVEVFYQGRVSKYGFASTVRASHGDTVVLDAPSTVEIASRRSPRIPLHESPVTVLRLEGETQRQGGTVRPLQGRGIDASVRGMRLALSEDLDPWERVRLTLSLPDGPLTADGEVVRVERVRPGEVWCGIYFTGLGAQVLARLRRLGG